MGFQYIGEEVSCILCNSKQHETVSLTGRKGQYLKTVICSVCGLVFTNPLPTEKEINTFYKKSYRTDYKGVYEPKTKHIYRASKRALSRYKRVKELGYDNGRLLDVGSGGGEFLYLMQHSGFDVKGIEPNLGYGKFSQNEYDLDIKIKPLNEVKFPDASFDIITLNHVLEHLRNPLQALQQLKKWLAPKGIIIVEVPNIEATYHAPKTKFHFAHLYNFSKSTLKGIANCAGLQCIDEQLVSGVDHLNMVFIAYDGSSSDAKNVTHSSHHQEVSELLRKHTTIKHYFSLHPYRRVAANIIRPIKEHRALKGDTAPKKILDTVFKNTVQGIKEI